MTTNNSLLKNKYKTIVKAINDMISNTPTLRLTCDQLLVDKKLWYFEISHIKNEVMCRKLRELSVKQQSIEDSFCKYFIKTKIQKII